MKTAPILLLLCITLFSSCYHVYYIPAVQQVPGFREKNEIKVSGHISSEDMSTSYHAQAAWAVTDKLAVTGAFFKGIGDYDKTEGGAGWYAEGGAGYYMPLRKIWSAELYSGAGYSSQWHDYGSAPRKVYDFAKLYIQPSLTAYVGPLDIVISGRLSAVDFLKTHPDNGMYGAPDKKGYLFAEPALTLRLGGEWCKLQAQYQFAFCNRANDLEYADLQFSLGVQLALSHIRIPKETPKKGIKYFF
jgi:hypothetical protein